MRRLLTGLLLAAALTGVAPAAQPTRVLAVEWEAGGGKLHWVSPTTLRPAGPAVLNVGGAPAVLVAVSPDGKVAAIGGGAKGRLRFVRLDGLSQNGLMWLGQGSVFRGLWTTPNRLVVLLGGTTPEVVVVDPTARRVVARTVLKGFAMGAVRAGPRLLTLLTRPDVIAPAQLAVIDADGLVRTVALPGIEAGWAKAPTPDAARAASPGLASDGAKAFVVGRESLVSVNLDDLTVDSHALVSRSTEKLIDGWGRSATWVGGSRIAIAGWSSDPSGSHGNIGVRVVDVSDGTMRTLDADATRATRVGSTLLVHGGGALHGYRLDGTRRYTILRGADTGYVQVAGRYAYVGSHNSTRFTIVDVEKGRVAGRAQTMKPTVLLEP